MERVLSKNTIKSQIPERVQRSLYLFLNDSFGKKQSRSSGAAFFVTKKAENQPLIFRFNILDYHF